MAFNNFYLEPNLALSPMSVIYDFDLENRENCAPTYASLSNVQAFDTPPRSFGTVITNSIKNNGKRSICENSNNVIYQYEADISSRPPYFNNSTMMMPICQMLPTSLYDSNLSNNPFILQNILDSPPSSNTESNFSFTEPTVYQLESNMFDMNEAIEEKFGPYSTLSIDESFSKFIHEDTENDTYCNVKLEEPDEPDSQIVKLENDYFEMNSTAFSGDCSQSMETKKCILSNLSSVKKEPLDSDDQVKSRKIFPFRLWDLASDEQFEPLSWNADGTLLVVNMQSINHHLMKICRTKKFASFLRQLHLYGFRKEARCLPNMRSTTKIAYYQHQYFLRHDPELLHKINRIKLN